MTEEQKYSVVEKRNGYELRKYAKSVIAEVQVSSDFSSAGNIAFRYLINFISGNNANQQKIAMTAPVLQSEFEGNLQSTQSKTDSHHLVSFVMPVDMNLANTPLPKDPKVKIRELPEQLVAVSRFTGRWSEHNHGQQLQDLRKRLQQDGLNEVDSPRFARFDPPWTPWFMRRNEIQIPVEQGSE